MERLRSAVRGGAHRLEGLALKRHLKQGTDALIWSDQTATDQRWVPVFSKRECKNFSGCLSGLNLAAIDC